MNSKTFEVEIRGILTQEQYNALISRLNHQATSVEPDDRETTFFIIPDKTLKVTKNLSSQKAKVALKIGNIKTGEQEEIEMNIPFDEYKKAVKIFCALGFTEIQETKQRRINFAVENIVVSVKHSDDWGYHYEMDLNVATEKKIPYARERLVELAKKLGLEVLTDEQIKNICDEIDKKHRESPLAKHQ